MQRSARAAFFAFSACVRCDHSHTRALPARACSRRSVSTLLLLLMLPHANPVINPSTFTWPRSLPSPSSLLGRWFEGFPPLLSRRSSFQSVHVRSSEQQGWMDGGRWRRRRRGEEEAFEVRKSGSLLAAQLHGLDLCRFQGSVRRPDERQSAALRKPLPM